MIVALELAHNVGGVYVVRISVAVSVLEPHRGDFVADRIYDILMEGWEHEGNSLLPFAKPLPCHFENRQSCIQLLQRDRSWSTQQHVEESGIFYHHWH